MFGFKKIGKVYDAAISAINAGVNEYNQSLATIREANAQLDSSISSSETLLRELGYGEKVDHIQDVFSTMKAKQGKNPSFKEASTTSNNNQGLASAANHIMNMYNHSQDRISKGVGNPFDHRVVDSATKLSDSGWVDEQIRKINGVQLPSGYTFNK